MCESIIPIVMATDEHYVPYCGTAVFSVIRNSRHDKMYKIFILYDVLSFDSRFRLESMSCENVTVKCVCVHKYVDQVDVKDYLHITVATVYRLFIPEIFCEYPKIVYLDSDIILRDDISGLYSVDIGDNYIGAFHNVSNHSMLWYLNNVLKIKDKDYFNAGVLLINVSRCIEDSIQKKCLDILRYNKEILYMDQCALNIACKDNVYYFEEKWNYQWLKYLNSNEKETEYKRADEMSLIHYDSDIKPWDNPDIFLSSYFWDAAKNTVFYEHIINNMFQKKATEIIKLVGFNCKKIVVYGAGDVGKQCIRKILLTGLCDDIIWVDRNYADIKGTVIPVENIQRAFEPDVERIIIAIGNQTSVREVKKMLVLNGVDEKNIITYFK